MEILRQGDVLLRRVKTLPNDAQQIEMPGRIILAEGEMTGHHHSVDEVCARLLGDAQGERYLEVSAATELTHQEHSALPLAPGVYRVVRQVEYTPAEVRRVAD